LREQVGSVVRAGRRLVTAHVELARAEVGAIAADALGVAARVAVAVAALLYMAMLLAIAVPLFLGDWLFGSLGWGILHAVLLAIAVAVLMVLGALRVSGRGLGSAFLAAALLGLAVAVALGLSLPNAGYGTLGATILPGVDPGVRPLVVGAVLGAVVLGIVGLLVGARSGGGGAVGGLVLGALVGLLLGAFTAISFDRRAGVATGIAVGLAAWPALSALALRGYEWSALRARFTPQASIDAAMETKAFVESRLRREAGEKER